MDHSPSEGFRARFRQHFRARIVSGFLFLLPIGITVLIIRFLYTFTAGLMRGTAANNRRGARPAASASRLSHRGSLPSVSH